MLSIVIEFADMLLASLLVGSIFGIWLLLNPTGLDAASYILLQQQAIRRLNRVLPALGMLTVLMTIGSVVLTRREGMRLDVLIAAVVCFAAAGLITRFLNQPLNAIVMTWSCNSPPANWTGMRDRWRQGHLARLVAGLGGLCLLIAATLMGRSSAI